jgi:hypothetical protein
MKVELQDPVETVAAPSKKIPRKRRTSMEKYESSQAKVDMKLLNGEHKLTIQNNFILETWPL